MEISYDLEQDWNNSKLEYYLNLKSLSAFRALCILSGYAPRSKIVDDYGKSKLYYLECPDKQIHPGSNTGKSAYAVMQIFDTRRQDFDRLRELWASRRNHASENNENERHSPDYFIAWAVINCEFSPQWLDFAIEKGLFDFNSRAVLMQTKKTNFRRKGVYEALRKM